MNVRKLSDIEYKQWPVNFDLQYNRAEFCEYNKSKVNEIHYLLFYDEKKARFAIPFGENEGCLSAPFSAPFCMPGEIGKKTSAEYYREALEALAVYAEKINIKKMRITLPPFFYGEREISYWLNAALLCKWEIARVDLNYAMNLENIQKTGYKNVIAYNARKNLKTAYKKENHFYCCKTEQDFEKAYKIIQTNRRAKGYPLNMSYEQVEWTRRFVGGEWFSVISDEKWVASAVVFPVAEHIAQVIYWGDIPDNDCRAVNFLAEQLVLYYINKGIRYLDIGPSTDCGNPNYGLISFKESIGCEVSSKVTIETVVR